MEETRPETFPHSLEIDMFLEDVIDDEGRKKLSRRFARFRDKFEMNQHGLRLFKPLPTRAEHETEHGPVPAGVDEPIVRDQLEAILAVALHRPGEETPLVSITFIDKKAAARTYEESKRLFLLAETRSLRNALACDACAKWRGEKVHGRKLEDIVSSVLGKRQMQPVLDKTFGESFGNLYLGILIDLWMRHVCSLREGDLDGAERGGRLIDVSTHWPIIGETGVIDGVRAWDVLCTAPTATPF